MRGKVGKFAIATVLNGFNNFWGTCNLAGSSQVAVKKISSREKFGVLGEVCPSLRGRGQ